MEQGDKGLGVPASPAGYSAEPEPVPVSAASAASIPDAELTEAEFCARFKAYMLSVAGPTFDDGDSIAEYADMAGPNYWDDEDCRKEGPEESAAADMSYWGED